MSYKQYPWKTRYAKLSRRGRKEGRKPRNLAAEEHLARCVYDDLLHYSSHEHIENPCYGLAPEKVRKGQGGSEAYRRTARALKNKTHLNAYIDEDGLNLKTGTELVPLLRKCTDPTDGHIDLPKVVRHIVGLYYIMHIDPVWLFDQLPRSISTNSQSYAPHYMCDILAFYLFRKRAIRCADCSIPIPLDWMGDGQIFDRVDRKLRHIIQSIKDDGDRANWKPYKGVCQCGTEASLKDLERLYGGSLVRKLEREALNQLRNDGTLNMTSLKPGQVNKQRARIKKLKALEDKLEAACGRAAMIEVLIEQGERALEDSFGGEGAGRKVEKRLAGLKKWQDANEKNVAYLSQKQRIRERCVADGEIPFFHSLEDLKTRNAAAVESYVQELSYRWQFHADMPTFIRMNFEAGKAGKGDSGITYWNLDNCQFLPRANSTFHCVILLGALRAGQRELLVHENVSLAQYAELHREEIREELAQHGVIRHFVLDELARLREQHDMVENQFKDFFVGREEHFAEALRQSHYCQALELMGGTSPDDIVALGKDYFKKSRNLLKWLCNYMVLGISEIEQARAAYRSSHYQCSGNVVHEEPQALDAEDVVVLRQLHQWSEEDFEHYGRLVVEPSTVS